MDFSASTVRRPGRPRLKPPIPIRQVSPGYPEEAIRSNIEGTVALGITVDIKGSIKDVEILGSVPGLDEAAIAAVKQWQYAVATFGGKPISYRTMTFIRFSLNASKTRPESML